MRKRYDLIPSSLLQELVEDIPDRDLIIDLVTEQLEEAYAKGIKDGSTGYQLVAEGFCPRGGGHIDGPDSDDYGACGGKWKYARLVSPWMEFKGWSADDYIFGAEVPSPVSDDDND